MRKLLATAAAALLLAACGQTTPAETGATDAPPAETQAAGADPIVFAAASLNQILPEIEPNANYSFDGSSGLVDQIAGGAPADVFASADKKNMDRAVEEGLIDGEPQMFATNYLVLVVPTGNPGNVTGFDDSLDGVKLVICAEEVPCGAATKKFADANELTLKPVSEETKVTDVLGKVASGEADAGLVYATDAASSDSVEIMDVPGAEDDPNTYWVAVVKGAAHAEAARAYVDSLVGEWVDDLQHFGFGPPL
ncbi:molybdate ABC transporter substrate-binding protein [Tessaracoccus massiliensis]|uniref:molybdate ABC transporter substrate-binding protein n=1 Tax=Tessaracoccus massiliensis TaxID=1522311 RepID=UPI000AE71097|nr:molybdate ABC transporter substrate-binding protein [Tessaracoccus massiliensis]